MGEIRTLDHVEELIPLAEATEIAHRNFLAEFEEKVWPIFQHYGYSKEAAVNHWMQCKVLERLDCVIDALESCAD